MPSGQKLSPDQVEAIRLGYADLKRSVAAVAEPAGVAPSTVRALARRHGWPRRHGVPPSPEEIMPEARRARDLGGQLAALERVAARTIRDLEHALAAGQAKDPERAARALALHVRTLASLRKLQGEREEAFADDERPPRSLAELRDELRGHLERIRVEERDRCLPGQPDQD